MAAGKRGHRAVGCVPGVRRAGRARRGGKGHWRGIRQRGSGRAGHGGRRGQVVRQGFAGLGSGRQRGGPGQPTAAQQGCGAGGRRVLGGAGAHGVNLQRSDGRQGAGPASRGGGARRSAAWRQGRQGRHRGRRSARGIGAGPVAQALSGPSPGRSREREGRGWPVAGASCNACRWPHAAQAVRQRPGGGLWAQPMGGLMAWAERALSKRVRAAGSAQDGRLCAPTVAATVPSMAAWQISQAEQVLDWWSCTEQPPATPLSAHPGAAANGSAGCWAEGPASC